MIKEIHAETLGSDAIGYSQRLVELDPGSRRQHDYMGTSRPSPCRSGPGVQLAADVRELALHGLSGAPHLRPVEVWYQVPLQVARARLEARLPRHPIHGELPGHSEWDSRHEMARPLALGPVLSVDTSASVDIAAVAAQIADLVRGGPAGRANTTPPRR